MGFFFFASRAAARFLGEARITHPSVSTAALLVAAASGGGLVAYADSAGENASSEPSQEAPRKKKVVVLGTGWAGTSFLKDLDCSKYEVKVISPRNYFAFTPLLPSVTCGTVEARSIVEPIRKMLEKKRKDVTFYEAECFKIDASKKAVHCRSAVGTNFDGNGDFMVDYDYLVVALGATVNTFNTPGVMENCYFLKEVEDAQKIRRNVIDCFEKASLPNISEEEKRKILHFVIIGGGPTGVEFAAEMHDFLVEDLVKLYPAIQDFVKITIIQSGEHILNMFDQRIATFAEIKFQRDGIEVNTGFRVVKVSDDLITMKSKSLGEVSVPYGMAVWSAGVGTRPVIMDFMQQIGQTNRRVLATNEWLRVHECDSIYAIGDCASITQRKIMDDISTVFKMADKDNSGTLTLKEINDVIEDICIRYPQVELYMKSMHMLDIRDLIKDAIGDSHKESMVVDIEEFKKALSHVDSQVKSVPATAQVAAQQGHYLAECFNKMDQCKEHPEGPLRMTGTGSGRHNFRPFRYKHLGQFAPLGGEQAAAELPGDWVSMGHSTQWLWYSVYASKQVSWRTRMLVVSDWTRRFIFGRDSSRI
uniref:NADH:ubiquinone reductase (non-electrogenic) n=1 Tax=Oryza punctata TaxID=4537 RepID=A0A0E0LEU3_ORYPU